MKLSSITLSVLSFSILSQSVFGASVDTEVKRSSGPIRFVESVKNVTAANATGDNSTLYREPRQDEGEGEAEPEERPYETVPRVFASIQKLVKGLVTGNVHEVLHGAFSFAPRNVSNQLIGVYNQLVGLPPPGHTTTLKPKRVKVPGSSVNGTVPGNSTTATNGTGVIVPLSEEEEREDEDEDEK